MLHITEFDRRGELVASFNDADRAVRARMSATGFVPVAASSPRAVWGRTHCGYALVTDDEEEIPEARIAGPITNVPAPVRRHEIEYRAYRAYIARERARIGAGR